jgi:hypothetical protein
MTMPSIDDMSLATLGVSLVRPHPPASIPGTEPGTSLQVDATGSSEATVRLWVYRDYEEGEEVSLDPYGLLRLVQELAARLPNVALSALKDQSWWAVACSNCGVHELGREIRAGLYGCAGCGQHRHRRTD